MHLSKLRCVELLTAVIQYQLWKSGEERREIGRLFFWYPCFLSLFAFPPQLFSCTTPSLFFIISVKIIVPLPHYVCLSATIHLSQSSSFIFFSPEPPVHPCSLYNTGIISIPGPLSMHLFLPAASSLYLSFFTALCHHLPSLTLPLSCSLIPPSLSLSLHPSFATIISVLVSLHLSLRVIISLPCFIIAIIIAMSYCLSPGVIISIALCFLSYPARVLGCFYSTHSAPIFIAQRTNTTTSLCLPFSPSSFLALSVSPLSNSLSKWDGS